MEELFGVLEFVTSVLVIVTLYLISRSHKWWLAYAVNSVLFLGVALYFGRNWFALMGFCLCITAIKNYIVEGRKLRRKKEESKDDTENPIS